MTAPKARGQLTAIGLAVGLTLPGLGFRISGGHITPWTAGVLFGLAVVGSAFLLAWAAEALRLDVSRGQDLPALSTAAL